ncbi:MAG TPA: hypothetical protein VHQ90_16565 [Thermoanaerobaculia bacterium]|nr:hypothetical protein [Thermoanaerobaculia bacterium]
MRELPGAQFFFAVVFLLLALPAGGARGEKAGKAAVEGHWEGAVAIREGETEVDLAVDFRRDANRELTGSITIPVEWSKDKPLETAAQQGSSISFSYLKGDGPAIFRGTLEDEGRRLTGELREANGTHVHLIALERRPARAAMAGAAEPRPLGPDLDALKRRFDADRDDVRLVVLLSPSCESCWMHARLLARHVFDRIDSPNLRAYIIWQHIADDDTLESAKRAAGLVRDPRVTQFYGIDRAAGIAFREPLGMKKFWAFDVFLLYGPGDPWRDPAPAPRFFMHNNAKAFPADRVLDGPKLASAVQEALAASGSAPASGKAPPP